MIIEPGIKFGVGVLIQPALLLSDASIYYDMESIIGGASDGTAVSSLTNYGTEGSTYDASSVPGRVDPTVITINGKKVLNLNGYAGNQWGYNIANAFTVGNGSLFVVGWDAFGNDGLFQSRLMGFGGQLSSPYQVCFFGFGKLNNSSFLFRDTTDGGVTVDPSYSSAGLQVLGIVKTGSTVVYYDNTTVPATYPTPVTGTFGFNTVGYRSYGIDQPSTGYLGDVLYYDRVLSEDESARVVTELKFKYGIA